MQNRVLDQNYRLSSNFHKSDVVLQHYHHTGLSLRSLAVFSTSLSQLGQKAAAELNEYSQLADKFGPQFKKRNFYGENLDEIVFHPAYAKMLDIAGGAQNFQPEMGARSQNLLRH